MAIIRNSVLATLAILSLGRPARAAQHHELIGHWPTCHIVGQLIDPYHRSPTMKIEMWFDKDRSRITGQAPIGVVFDQIQLLDQGDPTVYSRGQDGDLQSKPGAGVLWKPIPDDPQGKLLPSYIEEAQSPTKGPNTRILVDGTRHRASERIVNRPDLAEKLIFFTDLSSGRIVRIENYHTVIGDGKKIELHLTGAYTLHYGPVDAKHFDLKTLRTPKSLQPQLLPHKTNTSRSETPARYGSSTFL